MSKTFPAEISMGVGQLSTGGKRAFFEITDRSSRKIVCRIEFTMEQFGDLISGGFMSEHPVEWYATDKIGWVMEPPQTHEITVPSKDDYNEKHPAARAAVAAKVAELEAANPGCEVTAREDDAWNCHCRIECEDKTSVYEVVFWITSPPKEPT